MLKNEIIETEISSLNQNGEGVSKFNNNTIFVPRTIPGDRVKIKINRINNNNAGGELLKIIKPSEKRVKSGCNAFENGCGGCQWLHIGYREQLFWKREILCDMLKIKSKINIEVNEIIGMKNPAVCRNKFSFLNEHGSLVFMQESSKRTITLDNCPQEMEINNKVYEKLKKYHFPEVILQAHIRSSEEGKTGICFFVKRFQSEINKIGSRIIKDIKTIEGIGAASYREYHTISGRDYIEQKTGDYLYRIPLNGFFQTNYDQSGILLNLIDKSLVNVTGDVLDLYCGSGFFTLPAAAKAHKALGIDNNPAAIKFAGINAKINQIQNAEFIASDIKYVLKDLNTGMFQTVILDPPRSGCEPEVLKEILRIKPEKIIYISCSPETLARDLLILTGKNYKAVYCQPVDMFPHTYHIETLVTLELK